MLIVTPIIFNANKIYSEYVFDNLYEQIVFKNDFFGSKNGTTIYLENISENSLRTIGSKKEFRNFFDFEKREIMHPYKPLSRKSEISNYKIYVEIFSRFSMNNILYIYSLNDQKLIPIKSNSPSILSKYIKEDLRLEDLELIKPVSFNYIDYLDKINGLVKNGYEIVYAPIGKDLKLTEDYFNFFEFSKNEFVYTNKNFDKILIELNKILTFSENESNVVEKDTADSKTIIYVSKIFDSVYESTLYKSKENSNCLKIYHQGHGGDPLDFNYFKKLKNSWIEDGCDVIDFTMIGYGRNNVEVTIPIGKNSYIKLSPELSRIHDNYESLYYKNGNDIVSPLSIFTINQYFIIKELTKGGQYKNIDAVGISGGGLNVIFLSLLLPEIDYVISVNGSSPIDLDPYYDKNLDYEHIEYYLPDFYNEYSYWELYFVSSLMNSLNENRQLHMIYSVFDFCCFDSPDSIMLKIAIDHIDLQNLYIYLNNSDKHEIFPEQVFDIER